MLENGTNSGRCIIVDIFRLFFSRNWHETFQYSPRKVKTLELGFFAEKKVHWKPPT